MKPVPAKTLIPYFVTLFAVTLPFWILGSVTHIQGLPFNMQLNVLLVFVMPLVTIYFVARTYGASSLKQLFRDCLPLRRPNGIGLAVAFLTIPLLAVAVFAITQFVTPFDGWAIPLYLLPLYFAVYYVAAAFEEIGWTWFATPLLSKKMGIVGTGVVIGLIWSAVHTWPWFQQNGLWFMIGMIALSVLNRVVMTWLYLKNGRLLWLNIVYHAMINTTLGLFIHGSAYASPLIYAGMLLIGLGIVARRLP